MTLNPSNRVEAERREHQWLGSLACFSDEHDRRPQDEPPDPFRTAFLRDRDRVVHCGAFRRLKDKTQVFVIDEGDFYRTRLTHTLEVAQMARFLCLALRLNESLGEVLALVHDIGHPPFGHEGERILATASGVGFDHNSQALRIVDVLEAPYPDRPGLNLTHIVRQSILKHGGDAGAGAPDWTGHVLEAQVADLADSIAYQHHDLEDGLRAGILSVDELSDLDIWDAANDDLESDAAANGRDHARAVLSRMLKTSLHDVIFTSTNAIAASEAADAVAVAASGDRLVRFSAERARQHAELARFLTKQFYKHPRVLRSAAIARDAIASIVEHYQEHPGQMPANYQARIEVDGLQRSVCDYVAGMTDRFAIEQGQQLAADDVPVSVLIEEDVPVAVIALQHRIDYAFRDRSVAITALTHSSARSDHQAPNERLEFLGDSVLGLLVAEELFARYPDRAEGELSRIKSSVVSRYALRGVAQSWGLTELLTLGPGFRDADDVPHSVVADAVEAVLGAVFIDGGLAPVRRLVHDEFGPLIERASDRTRASNHKSELQAYTQGQLGFTPNYTVRAEEGPDHDKTFTVSAMLNGVELAVATGRNKRQAEQRAARDALNWLRDAADGDYDLPPELRIHATAADDELDDTTG